jgi:hypothetical protein
MMVWLALLAPRRLWLSLLLVFSVAAEGFVFFYVAHFETLRDRISMSEPWSLLYFLLIALALLATGEQRRVASIRLLRADRETAVLTNQAGVVLALLDQLGSPLQTLTVSIALVTLEAPNHPKYQDLNIALNRLSRIRDRLPKIPVRAFDYLSVSVDASAFAGSFSLPIRATFDARCFGRGTPNQSPGEMLDGVNPDDGGQGSQ